MEDNILDIVPEIFPACPTVGYQYTNVCVPVTITPYAKTGRPKTKCCGEPVITSGRDTCCGTKNGICSFTISQKLCVEVPIEFGAKSVVGDTYVECEGASEKDLYSDCSANTEID